MNEQVLNCFKKIASKRNWNYIEQLRGSVVSFVSQKNNIYTIYDYELPINSATTVAMLSNKSELSQILLNQEVPCIEYFKIQINNVQSGFIKLLELLESYGTISIKTNSDTSVKLIETEEELQTFVNSLLLPSTVIVSRGDVATNNYVCIVLNGKVELTAEIVEPFVVGDGESAVWELFAKNKILDHANINLNYIAKEGEIVRVMQPANASNKMYACVKNLNALAEINKLSVFIANSIQLNFGELHFSKIDNKILFKGASSKVNLSGFAKGSKEMQDKITSIYERAIMTTF